MGDRFYTQQLAYLKSIGKAPTTTITKKASMIADIEKLLGLEGKLEGLSYVTIYGLNTLTAVLQKRYG